MLDIPLIRQYLGKFRATMKENSHFSFTQEKSTPQQIV